ncbi:MAG: PAS domain-containing protein, partial [Thermoanaerobaculaceae bacterium]|nr:PAS domain-containing protein [Thermoanaerobaculaceae bacterium]
MPGTLVILVLAIMAVSGLSAWLWRRARRAEEARRFLEGVLNRIGDPVFVKDREHRLVLVNDAECRLAGRPRSWLVGKTDYDFFPREQVDV